MTIKELSEKYGEDKHLYLIDEDAPYGFRVVEPEMIATGSIKASYPDKSTKVIDMVLIG